MNLFFYLEIGIIIKIQIQGRGRINKNKITRYINKILNKSVF